MIQISSVYEEIKIQNLSSDLLVNVLNMNELSYRYVGRKTKHLIPSILGNPFKIGRDGNRVQVVQKYRKWLWLHVQEGLKGNKNAVFDELVKLAEYYLDNGFLTLICWCYPKQCHAEVIRDCIYWMIEEKIVLPF